jgi:hypothetical protein
MGRRPAEPLTDAFRGRRQSVDVPISSMHRQSARAQVRRQHGQGIGDAGILDLADQGDA